MFIVTVQSDGIEFMTAECTFKDEADALIAEMDASGFSSKLEEVKIVEVIRNAAG